MNATPRNASLYESLKRVIAENQQYFDVLIKEYSTKHPSALILVNLEAKLLEAMNLVKTLPGDPDNDPD